jgi:iron complex outermembrane recepter protein
MQPSYTSTDIKPIFRSMGKLKQIFNTVLLLTLAITSSFGASHNGILTHMVHSEKILVPNESTAILRGKITDVNNNSLQGASITIVGAEKGVNANEGGYYLLEKLQAGSLSVQVSIMGYETQIADMNLKPGHNELNFILVENIVHLDPVVVVAKKREQQILDVPAAISVVGSDFLIKNNIVELGQLSDYVPGLFIYEQGANRPSFIIRGLTSEEVSPSAQPRVSIYQNNVPINRASGSSLSLFDMERVEVLKGPQNTLFGRGAQIGAIHFISKSPSNTGEGYLSAGFGTYNQKEFRGAINIPLIENKLFVRAAGIYDYRDGYAQNTFGGTLNGKNTLAGRLSFRLLPSKNQQLDLILNYQKDDTPGIAFMSKQFPNTEGDTSIFDYRASLEQGKNLKTGKELFDATLYYRYNINEHTYLSSTSSYRKISSSSRWDGDGTAAPAIDMWDGAGADQIYQEIRYNYSLGSRLIGSAGVSYWHEDADQTYWFSPNEQSMAVLFLSPEYLILPNGQPLLIPALPDDPSLGPLAGMPLPSEHEENNYSAATNQAVEVFYEGTYQLMSRLFLTGGVRTAYENFNLKNQAAFTGGSPSTLGMMTGNYPNLFFRPGEEQSIDNANWSFNWQAGLQYKITEYSNVFINYANGRRPVVLQFTAIGTPEVLPAENVDNVDAGLKSSIAGKIFIDAVAFYQKYNDFQSRAWIADPETGEFNYVTVNGGKATSCGVETSINASLLKGLNVFGNYAYLNATFDDENQNGSEQEYAGNTFRLSPNHTFSLGFNAQIPLTSGVQAFITPSYAYRSHYFFEDANTPGLEQPGFGLLNINLGIEFEQPKLSLIFFGTNLLNEEYLISAGNTGSLFGVPTFVPGPPQMLGTKISWMFHVY